VPHPACIDVMPGIRERPERLLQPRNGIARERPASSTASACHHRSDARAWEDLNALHERKGPSLALLSIGSQWCGSIPSLRWCRLPPLPCLRPAGNELKWFLVLLRLKIHSSAEIVFSNVMQSCFSRSSGCAGLP
jgi:hypothetical protein